MKKILSIIFSMIMILGIVNFNVMAGEIRQDDISAEYSATYDKEKKEDKINAEFRLTNHNKTDLTNVEIKTEIPEGYTLEDGEGSIAHVKKILPGRMITMKTSFVKKEKKTKTVITKKVVTKEVPADHSGTGAESRQPENRKNVFLNKYLPMILLLVLWIIIFLIIRKKGEKRFTSLCLAVIMAASCLSSGDLKTEASSRGKIEVKEFLGEKDAVCLSASVSYDIPEKEKNEETSGVPVIPETINVTREEWITALTQILGLEPVQDGNYSFTDWEQASQASLIEAAVRAGIIPMYESNKMYPSGWVTREFAAYTAIHVLGKNVADTVIPQWGDLAEITFSRECAASVELGILPGKDGIFDPMGLLSKEEMEHALEVIRALYQKDQEPLCTSGDQTILYAPGVCEQSLAFHADRAGQILTIDGAVNWKDGEVHVVKSSDGSEKELAVKVDSLKYENGRTIVNYTIPQMSEIITSVKTTGTVKSGGTFTADPGVNIRQSGTGQGGTIPLFEQFKFLASYNNAILTGCIQISDIAFDFQAEASKITSVSMVMDSQIELEVDSIASGEENIRLKLGSFQVPLSYGIVGEGELYICSDGSGGYSIMTDITQKSGGWYADNTGTVSIGKMTMKDNSFYLSSEMVCYTDTFMKARFMDAVDMISVQSNAGVKFLKTKEDTHAECLTGRAGFIMDNSTRIGWEAEQFSADNVICNVDDSTWKKEFHFENGIPVDACTMEKGTVSGIVKDQETGQGVVHADIRMYTEGKLVSTCYTDKNGCFSDDTLVPGTYKMKAVCDGYHEQEFEISIQDGMVTTQNVELLPIEPGSTITEYTLSGFVKDSETGAGLKGASVSLTSSEDSGNTVQTVSDENGSYMVRQKPGRYKMTVTKDGYTMYTENIELTDNIDEHYIPLNPGAQAADNLTIVLYWNNKKIDLDAHLSGPYNGSRFHLSFAEPGIGNISLETNNDTGSQKEIVYIKDAEPGIYNFVVNDFTNIVEEETWALSDESQAYVEVYKGETLLNTFQVPSGCQGTYWHVFDYDSSLDTVIPVNAFSYDHIF